MKHFTLQSIIAGIIIMASAAEAFAGNISLDGSWTLDFWEQGRTAVISPEGMNGISFRTIPATVPGNVELDLLAAGLIEQPELGSNVYLLRKYEGYQWRYSRHFKSPSYTDEDDLALHFGGIDCYAEDLFFGSAGSLALFSDIASKGDDGLLELLSFFGKTYDEFLLDVFYWYGVWVEAKVLEGDSDCEECAVADSDESDYIHLVKSVLRHLCEDTLCIEYDSELCTLWEFAVANGGVWYRRYDTEMVDDITFYHEEFGCVMQDDPDGMAALRDAVLTCFCEDSWYYEEEGDALGLLGIKQEELFDLD